MKNKGLNCLGWVIIVIVAFWVGRLTAPEKVRVEKVPGPETIIYKTIKFETKVEEPTAWSGRR